MMKAKWCIAALAMGFAGMAFADVSSVMTVDLQGPGGHSYRRYGNTNAVHAAARAISAIQAAIPDQRQCVVFNFNGGATVNAIASNSSFQVSYHQKVCSHQKCFLISFAADLRQGFGNRNTLKQLHL